MLMDTNLKEEFDYILDTLVKSGFYGKEDILEILEDQFFDEDMDFANVEIPHSNASNSNFFILEENFIELTKKDIIAIHNCGYDIEEGVNDAFELAIHLKNNGENPRGFCFYTFEDIEEAISESRLSLTFGDFEGSREKSLEIGKIIKETLSFDIIWNETADEPIIIDSFIWDKSFDNNKEFEMEGAYDCYITTHKV